MVDVEDVDAREARASRVLAALVSATTSADPIDTNRSGPPSFDRQRACYSIAFAAGFTRDANPFRAL